MMMLSDPRASTSQLQTLICVRTGSAEEGSAEPYRRTGQGQDVQWTNSHWGGAAKALLSPAEDYHQDYSHPKYPYIVFNDRPKVSKLQEEYPSLYNQYNQW